MVMPFELWREAFNDADLELARSSYARLSPEPYQPWIDKLDLKQFYCPFKSYLYCTEDNVLPQGEQWGWHPRMFQPLGAISALYKCLGSVFYPDWFSRKDYCGRARLAAEFAIANPLMSPSFNKQ